MSEKFNIPPLPPTEQDMDDLQKALIENQGKSLETESDILRAHRAGREEKIKEVERTTSPEKPIEKSENQKLVDSISRLIESGLIEQIKEHKSYPDLIHIPEMRTKAFASFNSFCNENKIPAAFEIMDVFELPTEKCTKGIAKVVTNVFEKGDRAREATWQEPERDRYRHGRYDAEDPEDYDRAHQENAPLPDDTLTSREMIAKLPKNILESKEVQEAAKQAFIKEIPNLLAGDQRQTMPIQRVDDMTETSQNHKVVARI